MTDLFVSYRYWHPGHREYRFASAVITDGDLRQYANVSGVDSRPSIRKIEEYLTDVACVEPVILYWRRMETKLPEVDYYEGR